MPLIKPEIQDVLRAAGLEKPQTSGSASDKLTSAGLSLDSIAEELTELAKHSGNESLRLRALETSLKVHGALKDQPQAIIPSFTIIIQSAGAGPTPSVNPILFPRQSLGLVQPQIVQQNQKEEPS